MNMRQGTGGRPAGDGRSRASRATSEAKILVTIDEHGELWIDDQTGRRRAVRRRSPRCGGLGQLYPKVVIRGDARLRFGDVRQTMLAIEQAGFHGVGLIAERASAESQGD